METLRVVLFSDEAVLRKGLKCLVSGLTDVEFSCFDLTSTITAVTQTQPDIVLLDHCSESNIGIVPEIQAAAPNCRIVLWVRDISTEVAWQAVELGVRGILKKTADLNLLLSCVRTIHKGEVWLERALSAAILTLKSVRLTRRESQLVILLAQGLKNKEIATALDISEGTVKVYISRLFEKVGAKDRLELALYGLRNMNWISGSIGRKAPEQPHRALALHACV